MNYKSLIVFLGASLIVGCAAAPSPPTTISAPEFITATLPAAPTLIADVAPTPPPAPQPTSAPTLSPVDGITTSELNVRADTFTASASLGVLPAFSAVQIVGKDSSRLWYQILFNDSVGWIYAEYVQLSDAKAQAPVIADDSARGVILRGVNVRDGADQDFASLGLLNPNDVMSVLAKNSSATWIQIAYPPAADGVGWVSADYIQIQNVESLPLFGAKPPTQSVAANAPPPFADGDSIVAPLARFTLSPNEIRAVQLQGKLSTPNDDEDWAHFSADAEKISIQILCDSPALQADLFLNQIAAEPSLRCGETRVISLLPKLDYDLRVSIFPADSFSAFQYELRIKIIP